MQYQIKHGFCRSGLEYISIQIVICYTIHSSNIGFLQYVNIYIASCYDKISIFDELLSFYFVKVTLIIDTYDIYDIHTELHHNFLLLITKDINNNYLDI